MKRFKTPVLVTLAAGLLLTVSATFVGDHNKYFEISKNIEIFTNLYKELNTYYVDDLDPSKLMRIGIDAMVESLDPYTNYISESDIEGYRFMTEGKYTGIGAQFKLINDFPTITETYEGTPAQKSGLRAGDEIVAIDGRSARSKSAEDVNEIMKGFPGTSVELTVRRPGTSKELRIKLVREEVQVQNVPYSGLVADNIGYIALTTFTRDAGQNVSKALQDLKSDNPGLGGVILDLRDNGGGLLTEAVNLCNVFIPRNELVVSTKGKVKEWDRSFKTLNEPIDPQIPLVILINKYSASASEIVSGTIQDFDRGVLIGQRSYGKGLVQNTHDVGYNAKVKITTSKYYIPSGRCIQGVRYKNGEPIDIPDNERAQFKTRNGRTVLDGGGVKPDLLIDQDDKSEILTTLKEKNLIFDYVTRYCLSNDSIADLDKYHFTDWSDFVNYLSTKNYDFDTESEKLVDQLRDRSKEDGYIYENDINALEGKIIEAKKKDLTSHQQAITDQIEKELASRYYYQNGRIRIGLRNDKEIQEAIRVLNDQPAYKKLLSANR
jgi:carboxyl-terminal processing protease